MKTLKPLNLILLAAFLIFLEACGGTSSSSSSSSSTPDIISTKRPAREAASEPYANLSLDSDSGSFDNNIALAPQSSQEQGDPWRTPPQRDCRRCSLRSRPDQVVGRASIAAGANARVDKEEPEENVFKYNSIEFFTLAKLLSPEDTSSALFDLRFKNYEHKVKLNANPREISISSFDHLRSDALVITANDSSKTLGELSYHKEGISYPLVKSYRSTVHVYLQIKGVSYCEFSDKMRFSAVLPMGSQPQNTGDLLSLGNNHYRVEQVLGQGGFGKVLKIKNIITGRNKAFKSYEDFFK